MKYFFGLLVLITLFTSNTLRGYTFFQSPQEKTKALIIKANEVDNPTVSLAYLNKAYQYMYELEDSLEASLYLNLGVSHTALSHIDSANYFLNQALNLATKNSYKSLEASALEYLGNVAKIESNYEQATNYYALALKKNRQNKLILSKSKKVSDNNSNAYKNGALIGSTLIIFLLAYFNINQRKKIKQKEKHWQQEFSKLTASSEIIDSKKFSLSIKTLNEHINSPLSQREYEVLCLVVTNKTNTLIAKRLFVSVNTVKTHLKKIFEKLNVTSRKNAIEKVIFIKSKELK